MKNIFKSKRNILIMMFALVVIMGIGFAAYSQQLEIKDTSSIDSNWNVYIKSVDPKVSDEWVTGSGKVDKATNVKADLTTDLKYPGDNVIYKITVANDGTIDAVLEKINFSMEKEGTVIKYYYSVDDQVTWNEVAAEQKENSYNEDLLAKTTDDFYVKVEYDPTKTGTATEEEKSNKLTLEFIYTQKTGGGAIIPDNTVSFGGQTVTLAEAGEDGLYEDEYESTEESKKYVYKGANPSNYIKFNNELWRIISVESGGALKIIRNEVIGNRPIDSSGVRTTGYCSMGSIQDCCNAWAKMGDYFNGALRGSVDKDAELNTYLNTTYYNTIMTKDKIQLGNFYIGAVKHDDVNLPLSTSINQEKSFLWKGNIGLLTITEYARANINCNTVYDAYYNQCTDDNWVYTTAINNTNFVWLLSPFIGNAVGANYNIVPKSYIRQGDFNFSKQAYGVLPVLYLTSEIILEGEGTSNNPYTIVS